MTSLQRLNGPFLVGVPVTLADGSSFIVPSNITIDATGNPITASNPLPTRPPVQLPAAWTDGTVAQDARLFDNAILEVSNLSGGDTISITASVSGASFSPQYVIGGDFLPIPTITANGNYRIPGRQWLKYTKSGSASTPTITFGMGG